MSIGCDPIEIMNESLIIFIYLFSNLFPLFCMYKTSIIWDAAYEEK